MDDGLADILELCLDRLAAGASLDECLAAYPAQRGDLEPALQAAAGLKQLPRPALPPQTRAALEAQMLARAAARRAAVPAQTRPIEGRQPWWRLGPSAILAGVQRALGYGGPLSAPWLRIAATAVALVLALLLGAGAYAAASSIISILTPPPTPMPTPTPTPMPTATPSRQMFTIEGIVQRIDQEAWLVNGATIAIDARTTIVGTPAVGAMARVSGVVRADGSRLSLGVLVSPIPTTPPTSPPTSPPAPTIAPTPIVFPTITPSPAPPPAIVQPGGPADDGKGDDKQCQGQQKGRDEKKCDPKPKDDKKDNKKDDKKDDKKRK
jgi:hypothetical protein